jgi:uracil-DNA glycosylase
VSAAGLSTASGSRASGSRAFATGCTGAVPCPASAIPGAASGRRARAGRRTAESHGARFFTATRAATGSIGALHAAGFASQPTSVARDDGLRAARTLRDARPRAARRRTIARRPSEFARCRRSSCRSWRCCARLRVVVALGKIAHDGFLRRWRARRRRVPGRRPRFAHGVQHAPDGLVLLCSYHPSQQNTFTGRLTRPMLDAVFAARARRSSDGRFGKLLNAAGCCPGKRRLVWQDGRRRSAARQAALRQWRLAGIRRARLRVRPGMVEAAVAAGDRRQSSSRWPPRQREIVMHNPASGARAAAVAAPSAGMPIGSSPRWRGR